MHLPASGSRLCHAPNVVCSQGSLPGPTVLKAAVVLDLMTPRHESVRMRTSKLVERLARAPEGHAWVLWLLLHYVEHADSRPYSCSEFYGALCDLLTANLCPDAVRLRAPPACVA